MPEAMTVEGSLDILWINSTDTSATPRYDVIFSRYAGFKNGAQQPNKITGRAVLEDYLTGLGFTSGDSKNWVRRAHDRISVSIPNVIMPDQLLADYGI
jgi:hypothetical protein